MLTAETFGQGVLGLDHWFAEAVLREFGVQEQVIPIVENDRVVDVVVVKIPKNSGIR